VVDEVMFATMVHELDAEMPPPVSVMLPEPATAVALPPQLLVSPLGVATVTLAGSVMLSATPLSDAALPLLSVMVRVLVPPVTMLDGLSEAVEVGALGAVTTRVAEVPALPAEAPVALGVPAGMV
jgi:hypothetical protein